ncbi:MAG: hypothetical protein JNM63_12385 [Spirochaetia bacterium]|nr:hypothetical protein [Spirochaetia bacterium]
MNHLKSFKKWPALLSVFALCFGLLCADPLTPAGSQLLIPGLNPVSLAQAGAFVTEDTPSLVSLTPMSAATLLRHNASVNYLGNFGTLNGFSAAYSLPTLAGVFSFAYTGLLANSYAAGSIHNGSLIFSKEISTRFRFGTALGVDVAQSSNFSGVTAVGVHLDLGMLYESPTTIEKTIGLGHLRYGILFRNIGLPPTYNASNWLKSPELRAGLSFDWLRFVKKSKNPEKPVADAFLSRLVLETGLQLPFNFLLSAALKNTIYLGLGPIESLSISGGYTLGTTNIGVPNVGPWSAGATLHFDFNPTDLYLNYSLTPENISGATGGFFHGLSISIAFGYKDNSRPVIDLGDFKGDAVIPSK